MKKLAKDPQLKESIGKLSREQVASHLQVLFFKKTLEKTFDQDAQTPCFFSDTTEAPYRHPNRETNQRACPERLAESTKLYVS